MASTKLERPVPLESSYHEVNGKRVPLSAILSPEISEAALRQSQARMDAKLAAAADARAVK